MTIKRPIHSVGGIIYSILRQFFGKDLWLSTSPFFKVERNGEYLKRRSNWVIPSKSLMPTFLVVNDRLDEFPKFNLKLTVMCESFRRWKRKTSPDRETLPPGAKLMLSFVFLSFI